MKYKPQPDQAAVYVIYPAYAGCEILNGKAVQCEISGFAGCDSNFKGAARTGGSLLSCEHFIIMNYEL